MTKLLHKLRLTLSMIAFSHSIFALPFALSSYVLAHLESGQAFSPKTLLLVVLCMVTARNSAMAFNRWIDRKIDAKNPRTASRELPSGQLSPQFALGFTFINSLVFIFICYFINKLSLYLSPIALIIILGYSASKRFTDWSHFVLGLSLAIAPIGASIAATGEIGGISIYLGLGVLFWVSGFDILYSLQDEAFDRSQKLHSVPARLGTKKAIFLSRACHVLAVLVWLLPYFFFSLGFFYLGAVIFMAGFLFYEQSLISPQNLSRLNRAFFTANGLGSVVFFIGCLLETLFR